MGHEGFEVVTSRHGDHQRSAVDLAGSEPLLRVAKSTDHVQIVPLELSAEEACDDADVFDM